MSSTEELMAKVYAAEEMMEEAKKLELSAKSMMREAEDIKKDAERKEA